MRMTEQKLAEAIDLLNILVMSPSDVKATIKDTINGLACEIEYKSKLTGNVVGYWAYGNYDQELPYTGNSPYIMGHIASVIKNFLESVK